MLYYKMFKNMVYYFVVKRNCIKIGFKIILKVDLMTCFTNKFLLQFFN